MNISSLGSSMSYTAQAEARGSAAVVGKVLDQQKTDGQNAVALIASAAPVTGKGSTISVYA